MVTPAVTVMRILVVEDNVPLANFVKKGLEAEHYAVDVAPDGEEAQHRIDETNYDLLILDLNLPKVDGIGVLRAVRPKTGEPRSPGKRILRSSPTQPTILTPFLIVCGNWLF